LQQLYLAINRWNRELLKTLKHKNSFAMKVVALVRYWTAVLHDTAAVRKQRAAS
jgi:hypothetical protein